MEDANREGHPRDRVTDSRSSLWYPQLFPSFDVDWEEIKKKNYNPSLKSLVERMVGSSRTDLNLRNSSRSSGDSSYNFTNPMADGLPRDRSLRILSRLSYSKVG